MPESPFQIWSQWAEILTNCELLTEKPVWTGIQTGTYRCPRCEAETTRCARPDGAFSFSGLFESASGPAAQPSLLDPTFHHAGRKLSFRFRFGDVQPKNFWAMVRCTKIILVHWRYGDLTNLFSGYPKPKGYLSSHNVNCGFTRRDTGDAK